MYHVRLPNLGTDFPTASSAPQATAIRRLQKDFQILLDDPLPGIIAMPSERNILEWHYVIEGTQGTNYEGGVYHGKLIFKPDFPWKPPAICMCTPSGRFLPNVRLCLSISDYHPESWNPGWTVSAILVGLHSFMNEDAFSTGCSREPPAVRRKYARESIQYNLNNPEFIDMFPELTVRLQARNELTVSAIPFDNIEQDAGPSTSSSSSRKRQASNNTSTGKSRPLIGIAEAYVINAPLDAEVARTGAGTAGAEAGAAGTGGFHRGRDGIIRFGYEQFVQLIQARKRPRNSAPPRGGYRTDIVFEPGAPVASVIDIMDPVTGELRQPKVEAPIASGSGTDHSKGRGSETAPANNNDFAADPRSNMESWVKRTSTKPVTFSTTSSSLIPPIRNVTRTPKPSVKKPKEDIEVIDLTED